MVQITVWQETFWQNQGYTIAPSFKTQTRLINHMDKTNSTAQKKLLGSETLGLV